MNFDLEIRKLKLQVETLRRNIEVLEKHNPSLVQGAGSSTDGNIPLFDGTDGKKIKDSGKSLSSYVEGASGSTDGNIPLFDGTDGKKIKDSGKSLSSYVEGASGSTDGNIPLFDGTDGKKIKDSGKSLSDYTPMSFDGGYYGIDTPNNDYIRTPPGGLLPYRSGGASYVGSAIWPFSNMFARGFSCGWGETNGACTGAFNAIMGTSDAATWLISGTSNGVFRGGIQMLDGGGQVRIYANSNFYSFTGNSGRVHHTGNLQVKRGTITLTASWQTFNFGMTFSGVPTVMITTDGEGDRLPKVRNITTTSFQACNFANSGNAHYLAVWTG